MVHLVRNTKQPEDFLSGLMVADMPVPLDFTGQIYVVKRGESREEIETLEDKAHFAAPDLSPLRIADQTDVDAVYEYPTGSGAEKPADNVQQRRLATAARTHDRYELPDSDREAHTSQGRDIDLAHAIGHVNIFNDDRVFLLDNIHSLTHSQAL
jgi:hypothetical protein